jgi:hypothetical protein
MICVHTQRIPQTAQEGESFYLKLPPKAKVLRAGIDPANGAPTLWYTAATMVGEEETERHFVVVVTSPEDTAQLEEPATHVGMWWAAAYTYHLFELDGEGDAVEDVAALCKICEGYGEVWKDYPCRGYYPCVCGAKSSLRRRREVSQ